MDRADLPALIVQPIGYVRAASTVKFDSPHQPDAGAQEINRIELLPDCQFELALQDLAGFDRIWVLSWFDRNRHWRPRVMPPRGPAERRGVFATRSPHRPNPIGLTCVQLLKVEDRYLDVGPLDLVDGTPIIDIKPYLKTVDCFPDSSLGWLAPIEVEMRSAPRYEVRISKRAGVELDWLRNNWGIDFTERAFEMLGRDPKPHRTRRILQLGENGFRMACGAWRLYFHLEGAVVVVDEVGKGYSTESLIMPGHEKITHREAQLAFAAWAAGCDHGAAG